MEIPEGPGYLWQDDHMELWLPDTPLGRIIAKRLEQQGDAEIIHPKELAESARERSPENSHNGTKR